MKKSCLGCKAFNSSFNFCALGYKTESYDIMGVPGVRIDEPLIYRETKYWYYTDEIENMILL